MVLSVSFSQQRDFLPFSHEISSEIHTKSSNKPKNIKYTFTKSKRSTSYSFTKLYKKTNKKPHQIVQKNHLMKPLAKRLLVTVNLPSLDNLAYLLGPKSTSK